jgi:hypothetical protein
MNICGARSLIGEIDIWWPDVLLLIMFHRPKEFPKASAYPEDSDEEESTVGKMPPSYDSEDE